MFPSRGELGGLTAFVSDVHLLPRVSSPHCTSVLIAEAVCGTAGMLLGCSRAVALLLYSPVLGTSEAITQRVGWV